MLDSRVVPEPVEGVRAGEECVAERSVRDRRFAVVAREIVERPILLLEPGRGCLERLREPTMHRLPLGVLEIGVRGLAHPIVRDVVGERAAAVRDDNHAALEIAQQVRDPLGGRVLAERVCNARELEGPPVHREHAHELLFLGAEQREPPAEHVGHRRRDL